MYAYVGNDPVNWVDPWGLAAIPLFVPPPAIGGGNPVGLSPTQWQDFKDDMSSIFNPMSDGNDDSGDGDSGGSCDGGGGDGDGGGDGGDGGNNKPKVPFSVNKKGDSGSKAPGPGKTGRKINQKRFEKIQKEIEALKKVKDGPLTRAERREVRRKLKALRKDLHKSEPHARKGQGYR